MYMEIGDGTCACSPPGASYVCSEKNAQWEQNTRRLPLGHSRTIFEPGLGTAGSLLLLGDSMLQFIYINPWSAVKGEQTSGQLSPRAGTCAVTADGTAPEWHRRMLPGFIQGMPVVQLFGSEGCKMCSLSTWPTNCDWESGKSCQQMRSATRDLPKTKREVLKRIRLAQARNVLIMEGHFMRGWAAGTGGVNGRYDRYGMFGMEQEMEKALRNMLVYLGNNRARHGGPHLLHGFGACLSTLAGRVGVCWGGKGGGLRFFILEPNTDFSSAATASLLPYSHQQHPDPHQQRLLRWSCSVGKRRRRGAIRLAKTQVWTRSRACWAAPAAHV